MISKKESMKKHPCTIFDPSQYKYCSIYIPSGIVVVVFNLEGIFRLFLCRSCPSVDNKLQEEELPWPDFKEDLTAYFKGKKLSFNYPVIMDGYSDFVKEILQITSLIPYGQVITYEELAQKAGKPAAARAAGQALSKNRTPVLIPCHRVVKKDGSPGGFSAGLSWKKELLSLEKPIHFNLPLDCK